MITDKADEDRRWYDRGGSYIDASDWIKKKQQ